MICSSPACRCSSSSTSTELDQRRDRRVSRPMTDSATSSVRAFLHSCSCPTSPFPVSCSTNLFRLRCAHRLTPISSRGSSSSPPALAATASSTRFSSGHPSIRRRFTGLPPTFHRSAGTRRTGVRSMGIARHDAEARWTGPAAQLGVLPRPVPAVVCMHRDLGLVDALGVGHVPADAAAGVDRAWPRQSACRCRSRCIPEMLRAQLDIPDD